MTGNPNEPDGEYKNAMELLYVCILDYMMMSLQQLKL